MTWILLKSLFLMWTLQLKNVLYLMKNICKIPEDSNILNGEKLCLHRLRNMPRMSAFSSILQTQTNAINQERGDKLERKRLDALICQWMTISKYTKISGVIKQLYESFREGLYTIVKYQDVNFIHIYYFFVHYVLGTTIQRKHDITQVWLISQSVMVSSCVTMWLQKDRISSFFLAENIPLCTLPFSKFSC